MSVNLVISMSEVEFKQIKIKPEVHKRLEDLKIVPRESFSSVIERLIDLKEDRK